MGNHKKKKVLWICLILFGVIIAIGFVFPFPPPSDGPFGYFSLPDDVISQKDVHAFNVSDNTELAYRLILPPKNIKARGVFVFIHGISVHSGWYTNMARKIAQAGIKVYLPDLRGHGRSGGHRGYSPRPKQIIDDLEEMILLVRNKNPDLPLFFGGHSYGSKLAINYEVQGRQDIDGLILVAPCCAGVKNNPDMRIALGTQGLLSLYLSRMPFPSICSIHVNWHHDIKDPLMVKDYTFVMTEAFKSCFKRQSDIHICNLNVPFLWIQGENDQIFKMEGSIEAFDMVGAIDKTLIFFPKSGHIDIINISARSIKEWIVAHCIN